MTSGWAGEQHGGSAGLRERTATSSSPQPRRPRTGGVRGWGRRRTFSRDRHGAGAAGRPCGCRRSRVRRRSAQAGGSAGRVSAPNIPCTPANRSRGRGCRASRGGAGPTCGPLREGRGLASGANPAGLAPFVAVHGSTSRVTSGTMLHSLAPTASR